MSVYRTLRLRGLDPTRSMVDALKSYLTTAQLPPLSGQRRRCPAWDLPVLPVPPRGEEGGGEDSGLGRDGDPIG